MTQMMQGPTGAYVQHIGEHEQTYGCDIGPKCTPVPQTPAADRLAPKGPGDSTPSHYQGAGMTPFDVIDAFGLDFYEGNALKYICRWRKKNGVEDLKKARHYVEILIGRAEAGE